MICKFLFNFFKSNYSDNIQKVLKSEYKKIHKHKNKIKNIQKKYRYFKFLWIEYREIDVNDLRRIKRHKYLINKSIKQINGIKKYYKKHYG